jgi:hypothetical protein
MKICDLTQFYSPVGGGVRRYVSEKISWMRRERPDDFDAKRHRMITATFDAHKVQLISIRDSSNSRP